MNKKGFVLEDVFEPNDYLYFYEDNLTEKQTNKEIEFIERELKPNSSMKILDLACGHGRHSNKLAEKGYKVTAIDKSSGFLKIAEEEAKKKSLKIEYIQKDMRELLYKDTFDIILLLFTAFGYFSDQENINILNNISNSLRSKGLFCFDIFNRDVFSKKFLPYHVVEKERNLMIDRCSFDSMTGRYFNNRIIIRDGIRKDKPFSIRLYNYNEIELLLSNAGFTIYKIFANYNSADFTSESGRINIIAQKTHSSCLL